MRMRVLMPTVLSWAVVAACVATAAWAQAGAQPKPQPAFNGFDGNVPPAELPQVDLGLGAAGLGALLGSTGTVDLNALGGNLGMLLGLAAGLSTAQAPAPGLGALGLGGEGGAQAGDLAALLGQLGNLGGLVDVKALTTLLEAYRAGAEDDPEAILNHVDKLDELKENANTANLEALLGLLQLLAGAQLGQGQGNAGAGDLGQLGGLGALGGLGGLGGLLGGLGGEGDAEGNLDLGQLGGLGALGGLLGGLGGQLDLEGDDQAPQKPQGGAKQGQGLQLDQIMKMLGEANAQKALDAGKTGAKPTDNDKTKGQDQKTK